MIATVSALLVMGQQPPLAAPELLAHRVLEAKAWRVFEAYRTHSAAPSSLVGAREAFELEVRSYSVRTISVVIRRKGSHERVFHVSFSPETGAVTGFNVYESPQGVHQRKSDHHWMTIAKGVDRALFESDRLDFCRLHTYPDLHQVIVMFTRSRRGFAFPVDEDTTYSINTATGLVSSAHYGTPLPVRKHESQSSDTQSFRDSAVDYVAAQTDWDTFEIALRGPFYSRFTVPDKFGDKSDVPEDLAKEMAAGYGVLLFRAVVRNAASWNPVREMAMNGMRVFGDARTGEQILWSRPAIVERGYTTIDPRFRLTGTWRIGEASGSLQKIQKRSFHPDGKVLLHSGNWSARMEYQASDGILRWRDQHLVPTGSLRARMLKLPKRRTLGPLLTLTESLSPARNRPGSGPIGGWSPHS